MVVADVREGALFEYAGSRSRQEVDALSEDVRMPFSSFQHGEGPNDQWDATTA